MARFEGAVGICHRLRGFLPFAQAFQMFRLSPGLLHHLMRIPGVSRGFSGKLKAVVFALVSLDPQRGDVLGGLDREYGHHGNAPTQKCKKGCFRHLFSH